MTIFGIILAVLLTFISLRVACAWMEWTRGSGGRKTVRRWTGIPKGALKHLLF